jgi:hypothetical protein
MLDNGGNSMTNPSTHSPPYNLSHTYVRSYVHLCITNRMASDDLRTMDSEKFFKHTREGIHEQKAEKRERFIKNKQGWLPWLSSIMVVCLTIVIFVQL